MLALKNTVLEPDALDSAAMIHPILAKQLACFVPLAADPVKLPVLICLHARLSLRMVALRRRGQIFEKMSRMPVEVHCSTSIHLALTGAGARTD